MSAPITVLVADDESDIRLLCRVNLEAEGMRVVEAKSGDEMLTLASREVPDIVLLDLTMPGLSGWEALEALRADPRLADVPVVVLSAHVGVEHEEEATLRGARGYLAKPFRTSALLRAIRHALD